MKNGYKPTLSRLTAKFYLDELSWIKRGTKRMVEGM